MSKLYEALCGGRRGPHHYDYAMPLLLQDLQDEQQKLLVELDEKLAQTDEKMYRQVDELAEKHGGTEAERVKHASFDLDVQTWRSRAVDLAQHYQTLEQVLQALEKARQTYAPETPEEGEPHTIADLLRHAILEEASWHKQWYLEQIAEQLGVDLPEHEKGIIP